MMRWVEAAGANISPCSCIACFTINRILTAQHLPDGTGFGRRLNNNQFISHFASIHSVIWSFLFITSLKGNLISTLCQAKIPIFFQLDDFSGKICSFLLKNSKEDVTYKNFVF
jgi:hypothetical protein